MTELEEAIEHSEQLEQVINELIDFRIQLQSGNINIKEIKQKLEIIKIKVQNN